MSFKSVFERNPLYILHKRHRLENWESSNGLFDWLNKLTTFTWESSNFFGTYLDSTWLLTKRYVVSKSIHFPRIIRNISGFYIIVGVKSEFVYMQKEVTGEFQSATKKEDNSDIYQKFTKNTYSIYRTLTVCDQYPPSLFLNQYNKLYLI
jgi:hypothetical protein